MYEVDERDRVVEIHEVPQSSTGAPSPLLLADEHRGVILAYILEDFSQDPDYLKMRSDTVEEAVALVRFKGCHAHMFGSPNDEAFAGHPLSKRGLEPYGAFRVEDSSWIRCLERMNSVHRLHNPERFWKLQHLVFSFHDSTFECICDSFEVKTTRVSIDALIPQMVKLLG